MKRFFYLPLVVFASFFFGCMSEGSDTIALPTPLRDGDVPLSIVPEKIRAQFEGSMPMHSGKNPPDISGQYLADIFTLVSSSQNEKLGVTSSNGKNWADTYFAFIKEKNGKLSYHEKQGSSSTGSGDDVVVEIVGNGNDFTAYFIVESLSSGIKTKQSTIISGTLASNGILDFHYAFVLLEKGPDPSSKLVPVNTYRIFKDGDGLAERHDWMEE